MLSAPQLARLIEDLPLNQQETLQVTVKRLRINNKLAAKKKRQPLSKRPSRR